MAAKFVQRIAVAGVAPHKPAGERALRMEVPFRRRDDGVVADAVAVEHDLVHQQAARGFDQ
jgi:hypothetical protein